MHKKVIYNCHTHIFTHKNVPNRYLPLYLVPLMRIQPFRWIMKVICKAIIPWTDRDLPHRLAAFISASYREDQNDNFNHLKSYYPKDTVFIILPMDLSEMGAGRIQEDINTQHNDLAKLANTNKNIIPFAHVDPRRKNAFDLLKTYINKLDFKGVKIYPTLGYYPHDPVLMQYYYPFMIEHNIPLIAHCSPGSVNSKKMPKKIAHACAHPKEYETVMKKFPKLRICLGHYGGISEWKKYLNDPRNINNHTWLETINDLIISKKYENLYVDISYTIFNFTENIPLLDIFLEDDDLSKKILFGSDYYMVEQKKYSEKRLSIDLRHKLGEKKFWIIANDNPERFLGLNNVYIKPNKTP